MRYHVLACDYDGTLAHHGRLDDATAKALERLRESGRKLVMVTGRELDELKEVCPRLDLFDRVVAENGALLYRPATREEKVLGEAPPEQLVKALRERGVDRLSVGRSILATWTPHETTVLEAIRDLGLEWHVIFNKGAVMVLPSGVNKATGLEVALCELGLSPHNAVGVGDAENDHAFLALCECGVAVANALPALKERADLVTEADHGAGVAELIDRLLADDLADLGPRLTRHAILLGLREGDEEFRFDPYGLNILVAGTSGSGKSTLTTGLLERLSAQEYQYAIIDPEGDYSTLDGAVVLGDPHRPPSAAEVLDVLEPPDHDVAVNLLGIALEHRPGFFLSLLPQLLEFRSRTGRPHWIVVDEAHHLLPSEWDPAASALPDRMQGMIFLTVHPESVARSVLERVGLLVVVGREPGRTIGAFCWAIGREPPKVAAGDLASGEAIAWRIVEGEEPVRLRTVPPRTERLRHSRKYAEGSVGPDRSFAFRGPEGKLNLKAQNLVVFLQMADGVDDATWRHHLRRGDYSTWFRDQIKDDDLAAEAERIEADPDAPPKDSRAAIREAISRRYTLPDSARPTGVVE